ncbi:MAG: hypothetical protein IT371_29210 [Deltaproteobacteria bacterium]|nr:hypothetical protein [Deltaproteobacteria bacterium]
MTPTTLTQPRDVTVCARLRSGERRAQAARDLGAEVRWTLECVRRHRQRGGLPAVGLAMIEKLLAERGALLAAEELEALEAELTSYRSGTKGAEPAARVRGGDETVIDFDPPARIAGPLRPVRAMELPLRAF